MILGEEWEPCQLSDLVLLGYHPIQICVPFTSLSPSFFSLPVFVFFPSCAFNKGKKAPKLTYEKKEN